MDTVTQIIVSAISSGTPLLLAVLGGILDRKIWHHTTRRRRTYVDGGGDFVPRFHTYREFGAGNSLCTRGGRGSWVAPWVSMCDAACESGRLRVGDDDIRRGT